MQFWKFFIFIALRHWFQLVKFQIKSSASLRWNDLKLWNFQLSQALPEEKMTTNYKNANQVKPSLKEGWLQITKTQIKSSISARWDDLKSQKRKSSQVLPQDEMTWNHKIPNQVKHFRKMRWLETTKFPIKSSPPQRQVDFNL